MNKNRRIASRWANNLTSPTSCRSLVLVDSTQIRHEEQKKCQKIYKKIDLARKKIEFHEQNNIPAFQIWLHSTFGQKLTQIRELTQKVSDIEDIVDAVYSLSLSSGYSLREAYFKITKKDSNPSPTNEKPTSAEEREEEELYRSAFEAFYGTEENWASQTQSYKEAFNEFKSAFDVNNSSTYEWKDEKNSERNRSKEQSQSQQRKDNPKLHQKNEPLKRNEHEFKLKELYRQLARKLHPDLNPGLEPKKLELWHQVQSAYESQDVERLETLSALSDMFDSSWNKIDGVSTLRKLYHELLSALKQLDKKIRLARKELSWNFHEKSKDARKISQIKNIIRVDLDELLQELNLRFDELNDLIEEWNSPKKKKKNNRTRRLDNLGAFENFK